MGMDGSSANITASRQQTGEHLRLREMIVSMIFMYFLRSAVLWYSLDKPTMKILETFPIHCTLFQKNSN